MSIAFVAVSACAAALPACSSSENAPPASALPAPAPTTASVPASSGDPFDVPIDHATAAELQLFATGDALFGVPLRDADGLGPLYTRTSCGACHATGLRGPGSVQKMVVVLADGVTPSADQSALPFGHTVHPQLTAGATSAVLPPTDASLNVKVTSRVGPSILGRGYVEAILDSEIERVAVEQAKRTDAIRGRINHVVYASEANTDTRFHSHKKGDVLIGRFGLKGRIGTLDDFTADALQGDMGITSPLRPLEFANPDGVKDDLKAGIDVTMESINIRSNYVRLTAIPKRESVINGAALFAQVKCSACHVPSMRTRKDYPIAAIADTDAIVYTDLLLHDMGTDLADGIVDGEATSRDWRTSPLIGLRFLKTYLHDSRATTLEQAVLMHGGPGSEATEAVALFSALPPSEKATLIAFVGSL